MTKISIIIPSFNQGEFLEETLLSVIGQNYPDVEVLVMDGGSKDHSVDIIKKYASHIAYWQSEKDRGQSDAINQGIRRASGEIVTWLNSDDVLLPGTLHLVDAFARANPTIQWFLGNVLWMNREGKIMRVGKVERESHFWNHHHLFANGGPSAFMRRERLLQIGLLREDFHYKMDTELWHRYLAGGDMFLRLPAYCWGLRLHEAAKMSGHNFLNSELSAKDHPSWQQKRKEDEYIIKHYPVNPLLRSIWRLYRLCGTVSLSRMLDHSLLGRNYTALK